MFCLPVGDTVASVICTFSHMLSRDKKKKSFIEII